MKQALLVQINLVMFASAARTLSVGFMVLKPPPPDKGLLSSHDAGHWPLCDAIASSSALL